MPEGPILIIGAGIAGTISAYYLAEDHDVIVFDKDQIASDTTSRASGDISTPIVYPESPELANYALSFFKRLDGTGTYKFQKQRRVNLIPPEMEGPVNDIVGIEQDRGNPVFFLSPTEAERRYPNTFDLSNYAGVLEYLNCGYIDPLDYVMTLKNEAESNGAEFRTDTEVLDVITNGNEVVGVETEYGITEGSHVVGAASWQTRSLLEDIIEIPVRPFRWQSIEMKPGIELGEEYPGGSELNYPYFWRRQPSGNLLVESIAGLVENPGEIRTGATDEFYDLVQENIADTLLAAEGAEVIGDKTCPTGDSATPDTMPIIDSPEESPNGLILATGFQRGGVLSSPIIGATVRSFVTNESLPFSTEAFKLSRFESRSADFELAPMVKSPDL